MIKNFYFLFQLNIVIQTITFAYILAFFAYITIEAPLRNILKEMFYKPSKEDRTNNTLNIVTAIKTSHLENNTISTKF